MNCTLKFEGHHSKSQVLGKAWWDAKCPAFELYLVHSPSDSVIHEITFLEVCASAPEIVCAVFTTLHRVNRPITDRLPMTEQFGRYFSILLYFEWFKNVIGATSQALQIIFEMQSQMTSPKKAVKKIDCFKLQNAIFFIFLHFDPSTFKPHKFFIHFKRFKVL